MKIAYATSLDPTDVNSWSGLTYYMLQALQGAGAQTGVIGNLRDPYIYAYRLKKVLYAALLGRNYHRDREPRVLKGFAAQVESALAAVDYDVVFSPGTFPIAYLQTDKPIVFWTDSSFAGMVNFYPNFSNLCRETIQKGNRIEQLALSKCRMAIYPSEWAAKTAIQSYDVDPKKVQVVPFGANNDCNCSVQEIDSFLQVKNLEVCKLLFIGGEWYRKGGDIAIKVAERLNKRGIRTELNIVGCHPPARYPAFVKLHGYISKRTQAGRTLFKKLMTESHFLILPSRAECFGAVFADASSYGLPSLATKVGGIPSAVSDGKNGYTFPLEGCTEKFCDCIERLMASKPAYNQLARSSYREYSERLNWGSSGRKIYALIQEFCNFPDAEPYRFSLAREDAVELNLDNTSVSRF